MVSTRLGIAPEGWPFIGLAALAALVCAIIGLRPVAFAFLLFTAFCLYFFRDPERVPPRGEGLAVSPADGRILPLSMRPDPFTGEKVCCISIFMNLFSVHVNRVPVACEIADIRYTPGKFFNASLDKASEHNERCAYQLKAEDGSLWGMVQIAGLVARRIVCRTAVGERLAAGQRCGMIRFGSRVDLYLPKGYLPAVKEGDLVLAGQSIIARAE